MRIVQTFWSGKGDPLKDNYSWLEPQYHLMSWALSCLSLRENYDEVVMYTDSTGYAVFADLLDLPYTDIIIQYDDLICPKHQWAYAKMLTYSLQDKPFIHIDGDVYLPGRLDSKIENAALIAQNLEIGVKYYRHMLNRIASENVKIPDFLNKELQNEPVLSYNAGILGGNDVEYIKKYCQAAFEYLDSNRLLDIDNTKNNSHNILFEQILFKALAFEDNRKVTTVLDRDVEDGGYSYNDFCNFYSYDKYSFMHIIGGYKRKEKICELLSKTLLKKYPEYYHRIIKLFPKKYKYIKSTCINLPYYKFINSCMEKWDLISNEDLLNIEKESCNYIEFLQRTDLKESSITIKRHPYMSIYEKNKEYSSKLGEPETDIACIPCFSSQNYQETAIDSLAYNILNLLDTDKTFKGLLSSLEA